MADSDTIRRLWLFKSDLEEGPDDEKLIQILRKLVKLPVSIASLQETEIGKVVNSFRKREGIAGYWVQKVVSTWKAAVEEEVKKQEEEEKRESSQEADSPHLNGGHDSVDSDDRESSGDEKEESQGHLVNGKHSGNSDSDNKEFDRARKIKQERLSSSEEDSEEEAGEGRSIQKSKSMYHSRSSIANEDDLTDSDLEEDVDTTSKESYIESYYQKMLGQIDVKKEESDEKSMGSSHGRHREIKQSSEKMSNGTSSSKVKKYTTHNKVSHTRRNCDIKKRYHDMSSSDEDKAVKTSCHLGKHESHSCGKNEVVHAKEKMKSQNGHVSHLSSSCDGNDSKHLISSSGDKYQGHSSSSYGEKHQKHSSSSYADKYQKHSSSSSGDKHQKRSFSSSGDKHQKSSSSSSRDKHQKHSSSSSGDKHQKHSSSSSTDKHQRRSSSSCGEKLQTHSSSSSGDKHQTHSSSSSGDKHRTYSSLSSGDKHQKHLSSSGEKQQKHSSSLSGEKLIKPCSKSDRHNKSASSPKGKVHKDSSSSPLDARNQKHSLSSTSVEKGHKHSYSSSSSSSQSSKHFTSSLSSSRDHSHTEDFSAKQLERNSPYPAYSPSPVSERIIKQESDEDGKEEENEYVPSCRSTLPVEYIPSRKIKSEHESSIDREKKKYVQSVYTNQSDECDSDRYSPTVGWKIKKEKVSDDHKYGGVNRSLYSPSTSMPTPLPYTSTKEIKDEKEDDSGESENDRSDDMHSESYIPTKKIKTDKDVEKSSSPSTYIPTEKIKAEKEDEISSSPTIYFPTKKRKKEKDTERSSSPLTYIPTKKIKKENDGEALPFSSESTYIPSKKIKEEKSEGRSPSPLPYMPTKQIKIEKGGARSPSPLISAKKIKKEKDSGRSLSPSTYLPSNMNKEKGGNSSSELPYHVTTTKIKKDAKEENISESSSDESDFSDKSGLEGESKRQERRLERYASHKKRDGGSSRKENHSRPHSFSSSENEESPQNHNDDVEVRSNVNRYNKSSKPSSSHKQGKSHLSSSKHSKTTPSSSSSSRTEKISSSSQGKSKAYDIGLVKEEKTCSSSERVVNHKAIKTLDNHKEHSSHSKASSSKSSKTLSSSDKRHEKTKEPFSSTSKASSLPLSSTKAKLSSSSSSTSKRNRDKKRKENLFSDACEDLFSDTIQITAEPSPPPPPRNQDYNKNSSNKSRSADVASLQTASSTSPTSVKIEKFPVKKSKYGAETKESYGAETKESNGAETKESLSTDLAGADKYGPSPEKKKKIKDSFRLDEGGMSFDDFLNFDEAAILKQKKATSSKKSSKSCNKPSGTSSLNNPSSHRVSSSSTSSKMSSGDTFSLSIPAPPKSVSVTESDILSMLPETQAFYRPLRPNPMYDREEVPPEPVDADIITSKSYVRSKVYSGRKQVLKEMKSLYDLCLQVLIDNVDALDYVGGVPYSILKPVLERCSATQLYQLEDCNPHFIEDSDELWESHCHRDFRGAEQEEEESWRELYLRKLEEQEAKYQKLKASMSTVITKGQAGRHAKLAFVDTVAKPPRDVLRQQKRYGTGCVVMASKGGRVTKDSGSAVRTYKPSITIPAHNPLSERPRMIKATPPMMAKALQMRKKLRR